MNGEPLRLRVVVRAPPPGVAASLQGEGGAPVQVQASQGEDLSFELTVRCDLSEAAPNFLGEFVRGPKDDRFVHLAWGRQAGQADSCWDRRAKVRLGGIDADVARRATQAGAPLTLEMAGVGKDGGPVCASFKPLKDWS